MQYNTSYSESIYSFVNNINTREGGTHVSGFRRAVNRVFTKYGEDNGMFSKLKFKISGEDFREGLTAIVSVKVPEPQFKGQTKGELGNSEVTGIVSRAVGDVLKHFLEENPSLALSLSRRNPYLDPLNHIQVTLLKRYRTMEEEDPAKKAWLVPLLRSINAIANGMRNTG